MRYSLNRDKEEVTYNSLSPAIIRKARFPKPRSLRQIYERNQQTDQRREMCDFQEDYDMQEGDDHQQTFPGGIQVGSMEPEEAKEQAPPEEADDDDEMTIGRKFVLMDTATGKRFEAAIYEPLINTKINGVKDVFKPIKNDKDLDSEVSRMCSTLADDKTADWKQRVNDLQRIQFIAQLYAGCSEHGHAKFSTNALINAVAKLVPCLIAQVLCLRSQNAKEAGNAIQMLAEALGEDFELAAFRLFANHALIKLMHAGKHILAEIGTHTVLGILHNVCSSKVLQRLASELQDSKSTYIHKCAGMFLLEIVSIYPKDVILSIASIIKPFIKHCITNPNGECRDLARKALLIWQQIDPQNSERIFHFVDQASQRAIFVEEMKFSVHAVKGNEMELRPHKSHDGPPPQMVRVDSRQGGAQGSPRGSPKRTRLVGSPKPMKSKNLDPTGARTVSRGKMRPGSAAAPGSNLRGSKQGSAQRSAKVRAGQSGSRLGGTVASTAAHTNGGLGFHAQQSYGSVGGGDNNGATNAMARTAYSKQPPAKDPLMGSLGSSNSGTTAAMKPPSCGGKKPLQPKKTPMRTPATVKHGTPASTTSYKYDFNPSQADVIMLSEKQQRDTMEFDFTDNFYQLQDKNLIKQTRALEELMRHIVNMTKEEISLESMDPNSKFSATIKLIVDRFCRREGHSSMKGLELQVDTIQFILNSIPESLFEQIGPICMSLVNCCVIKRNPKIQEKGYEVLDEIKRIYTEGVVLPNFIIVFQNERSTEFAYILEAMSFMGQLVKASDDLDSATQFEFITQTVGTHLENYLKYNRREKNEVELMLFKKGSGGAQKHMEIISLGVLISLRAKNDMLCMKAIMELTMPQIDYIKQIAEEYDESFSLAMRAALDAKMGIRAIPPVGGSRLARSPRNERNQQYQEAQGYKKAAVTVPQQQPHQYGKPQHHPMQAHHQNIVMEVDESSHSSMTQQQQQQLSQAEIERQELRAKMQLGSQMKKERSGFVSPPDKQPMGNGVGAGVQGRRSPGAIVSSQYQSNAARASPRRVPGRASPPRTQGAGYSSKQSAATQIQKAATATHMMMPPTELMQICDVLNDHQVTPLEKLSVIENTQRDLQQILWKNQQGKSQRAAQDNFEILMDCLIFFILKNANIKNQENVQLSKLEEQSSQKIANGSFDLLTAAVNLGPQSKATRSHGAVDTSHYFSGESSNASPLTLREKLVRSVLHTYTTDVPQQHQTFTNAKAEDLLRAIAANASIDFLGATASTLILEMEPPRLQAVLRMTETRVKLLTESIINQTYEMSQEDLEALLQLAGGALAQQLQHSVPDVRKTVVFALVEVAEAIGYDLFSTEVMEKHLNISQQRLVQIYIERKRLQGGANR